jgi:ABC-2 type transport system ATP-binding protein
MEESIIKTEGLGHKYSNNWAIRDINIDIDERGIYGMLGPNGAGKSTIMNIMCGVLRQTKGTVTINGINTKTNHIEAAKEIGYLPQRVPIYDDLTATEYLYYCARLRLMDKDEIPSAVEKVMEECGISVMKDRLVKNLSGGYRQRVGLAQAIIHRPKLVILDEPTTGLDPVQIKELHKLIEGIARKSTIIISSHVMHEIQSICQQIIMLEQGQIIFSDSLQIFENYVAPESMRLTFREAISIKELQNIEGVSRSEKLTSTHYKVFFDEESHEELSGKLIKESVRKDWGLMELTIDRSSMEDIFEQLTKN